MLPNASPARRTARVAATLAALCAAIANGQTGPAAAAAASPAADAACVSVEIRNVRAGQGALFVGAYADEAAFVARKPTQGAVVRPTETVVTVPLCGIAADTLAVMVYQDLNDNGRMDANAFGIPSEPYGSSGKPAPMAPPTWNRARVERGAAGGVVVVLSS